MPLVEPTDPTTLSRLSGAVRLSTLRGQFNVFSLVCVSLAIVTMIVAYWALGRTAQDFKKVIVESAPSIIAANQLGQELNRLDTDAADLLITSRPNGDDVTRKQAQTAQTDYEAARTEFDSNLLRAYANITFPGEETTIKTISAGFYNYLAQIEIMRFELGQNPPQREAALAAYKRAHDIVIGNPSHDPRILVNNRSPEELLKQNNWTNLNANQNYLGIEANVAKLFRINQNALDTARSSVKGDTTFSLILVAIAGGLLIVALVGLILRFAIVTHRLLNPGFGAALLISLVLFGLLVLAFTNATGDFETVSYTSFFSINSASQAKQVLRDFNGDESRLFLTPAALGLDPASPQLTPDVTQAFNTALLLQNFDYKKNQIIARVSDAWGNVTYPEERGQICQVYDIPKLSSDPGLTLQQTKCQPNEEYRGSDTNNQPQFSLQAYFDTHNNLVSLFQQGKINPALDLSYGQSNAASTHALAGLEGLARVNENYFNDASCSSIGEGQFQNGLFSDTNCSGRSGYLNLLQGLSLLVFTILALATVAGAWLSRRLF